jgi:hypothetical protein
MGLGRAPSHGSKLRLSGCIGGIFDRKSLGFFPAMALQSSSPSSLVAVTIRVDVVHKLRVVALVITVTGSWNFVWFCELFIELRHCFGPLSYKVTVQGPHP